MDYVDEGDKIVVRLDPGDRVLESLEEIRKEENLENGFFTGIRAVGEATLGHYDVEKEDYKEEKFDSEKGFEVTSFVGNIGPDKIHAHIELGKRDFSTMGGHCSGAKVSGTFEIIILKGETRLSHRLDESTGLDVFDI
ncbi:MAG: PPC domain-containing DNA-binding protein [Candidatus Nanosalina sp.]